MTTRRWRTMGRTMRRIYVAEAKHVAHDISVRLSQGSRCEAKRLAGSRRDSHCGSTCPQLVEANASGIGMRPEARELDRCAQACRLGLSSLSDGDACQCQRSLTGIKPASTHVAPGLTTQLTRTEIDYLDQGTEPPIPSPAPTPDLPGIGGPPPPPPPICRGSGVHADRGFRAVIWTRASSRSPPIDLTLNGWEPAALKGRLRAIWVVP